MRNLRIRPMVSLKAVRKSRGITVEELAGRINELGVQCSVSHLNSVESGQAFGSQRFYRAWEVALMLEPGQVLDGEQLEGLVTGEVEPRPQWCPRRRKRSGQSSESARLAS